MFSRVNHMLGNKASLNKFKKIEIISSILSNHNSMKLEGMKDWRCGCQGPSLRA